MSRDDIMEQLFNFKICNWNYKSLDLNAVIMANKAVDPKAVY